MARPSPDERMEDIGTGGSDDKDDEPDYSRPAPDERMEDIGTGGSDDGGDGGSTSDTEPDYSRPAPDERMEDIGTGGGGSSDSEPDYSRPDPDPRQYGDGGDGGGGGGSTSQPKPEETIINPWEESGGDVAPGQGLEAKPTPDPIGSTEIDDRGIVQSDYSQVFYDAKGERLTDQADVESVDFRKVGDTLYAFEAGEGKEGATGIAAKQYEQQVADEAGINAEDIAINRRDGQLTALPTEDFAASDMAAQLAERENVPGSAVSVESGNVVIDESMLEPTGTGRDTTGRDYIPDEQRPGSDPWQPGEGSGEQFTDPGQVNTDPPDTTSDTEGPYIPDYVGPQSGVATDPDTIRSAEVDKDVLEAYRGEDVEGFNSDRTLQAGLLNADQEKRLQDLAKGYSETVTDITGFEGSTGAGRAIRGAATGAASIGNLPQWALGIETVTETVEKTPEVVAQEGLSDTLETFTAGGREVAEGAGEAVAEDPVGTISKGVGALGVGLGAGAIGRRALVGARGRLGTRNMDFQGDIDMSDLERPDVSSGDSRLTRFSEDAVPGGKRAMDPDDFPVESAPGDPSQELKNLAKEYTDADLEDALGTQSDEFTLFSARSGTKGESFTPRSGRPYDPDAAFFSGSVSSNFLDVPSSTGALSGGGIRFPKPIAGAKSLVRAAKGEDTPTIVATAGKIDEIPEGVTGQAAESQFLRQQTGTGTFFTRRPETQSGEAEALISARAVDKDVNWRTTTESEATEFVQVGDPFKTQYQGETVPIQLFRPATKSDIDAGDVDTVSRSDLSDLATSESVPGGQSGTPAAPTPFPIGGGSSTFSATGTGDSVFSGSGSVFDSTQPTSTIPSGEPGTFGATSPIATDPTDTTDIFAPSSSSTAGGDESPSGIPTSEPPSGVGSTFGGSPTGTPTEPTGSPVGSPTGSPIGSPTEPTGSPSGPPSSPGSPVGSPGDSPTSPITPPPGTGPTPPNQRPRLPELEDEDKEKELFKVEEFQEKFESNVATPEDVLTGDVGSEPILDFD